MSWRNEYKKKRRCVTNHTDGAKAFQKTVGVIPPYDIPDLLNRGVAKVFGPGTSLDEIVTYIRKLVKAKAA